MGAATAALSWLRPPATIVRGAPTPGSRRRRRTRLVAATTGGAVGQIRAAANRVGVGIAADGALAGCVRLHAHLRQGRLVAATTGGAVGQIRAAANRVGVGIAAHLAGARRRRRRRSRRRRRTRLVAATAGGQSDKSGQRPIGLEWGSQPMEHLLDAFACTSPVPRPPCSSNHWRGSRTSQGSGQSGWSGDRSPPCRGPKVATATESAQASDPPCRSNHWRGSRTSQGSGQSGWSGDRSRWSTCWIGDRSPPCRGPKVATATESAKASDPPCRSNRWRGSRTSQDSGQSGWSGDRSRWSTRWMRSPPERPSPPRGAAAPGPPRRSRPRQRRSPPLRGLRRSRPPARSTPACREP
ncbi:unnamed protein product [Prorocentrum cordatum]|uniref:Uncharacterized protein n=1 Tax=Prorocentrum cordatum TaxID=2364126 RepID=A0ABN9SXL6_9DINO|nr:unnamed protein product [Polarella glacialis]